MIRFLLALTILVVISNSAFAQQPAFNLDQHSQTSPSDRQITPGMIPEIWFYMQQLQRHDDPKQAVRRKAEFRAEQRQKRMAAMKWFGQSNQRPQASPTPFYGTYSPYWAGNGADPYQWVGQGVPATISRSTNSLQR